MSNKSYVAQLEAVAKQAAGLSEARERWGNGFIGIVDRLSKQADKLTKDPQFVECRNCGCPYNFIKDA